MSSQSPVFITGAVEGIVDEAALRRLVCEANANDGPVYGKNGKSYLLRRLNGYNNAARFAPWLILIDLNGGECPPPAKEKWLPHPSILMCFSIAVRGIESWLMSDRKNLARFLRIRISQVPRHPETENDPKRKIVDLARDSRSKDIREDMVPRPGSGIPIGPAYSSRLIEYIQKYWQPSVAADNSPSLARCRQRLRQLIRRV